ncbi:hypothetical protein PF003_g1989 [Phytophthora fragariae]|nr:hypothetical protein PF003_g1989 [Phytophthora fragariae]
MQSLVDDFNNTRASQQNDVSYISELIAAIFLPAGFLTGMNFLRRRITTADEGMLLKMEKKLNLLHEMSHPNLVQVFGASHANSAQFIVYEDVVSGNLSSFLARSGANKRQMWAKLYQAPIRLDFIHKKGTWRSKAK